MNRRSARLAATFLVGVLTAVIMPLTLLGSPASAAVEQFTLTMSDGQLKLRGADPFALETPTTLTGTNTDGQLTGVELDTPTVSTRRDVPEYGTYVDIDATFSMVAPGIGTINEQGDVTIQLSVAVDLHLVVPILPGASDCRAAPINLTMTSTAPYDPEAKKVTLRAPNFSVPPVVASPQCNGLLVEPVNEALAGPGHSLTLNVGGTLTPPVAGEPTATALEVTPAGSAPVGDDVTLKATVTPNPAVPGAPPITGLVSFVDGGTTIGTAPVEADGTATLVTPDLPAGPRELTAVYGGSPPDWDPSTSPVVAYDVIADPAITTTAAGEVRPGGPGKDFEVRVLNTGFGAALDDARLEVTINRAAGSAPIQPNGPTPRLVLSRVVNGVPTAIPLTYSASPTPGRLSGIVGDADTWDLDPGEEHPETLRLEVAPGVAVGPLNLTFTLVTGTAPDEVDRATTSGVISIVNETRQATSVEAGDPGFPPFIPLIPAVTPLVRQGNVAEVSVLKVVPTLSGLPPTGTVSFAIDGVPVLAQGTSTAFPSAFTWEEEVPFAGDFLGGSSNYLIKVPSTIPTGTRQVTVRYSGDGAYGPSQANFPFTVEPKVGTVYECAGVGVGNQTTRFTANVEVEATLPPVAAAGQDLPVDRVRVRMRLSRTGAQETTLSGVTDASEADRDWRLELGPDGTIIPSAVTSSNEIRMTDPDPDPMDRLVELTGGTGDIPISATPGQPTKYTLDVINVTATLNGFRGGFTCTPGEAPYTVGTITPAGTTLTVTPGGPVGSTTAVTLTATALPAAPGVIEFRDGGNTIGVVPVDAAGVATMTTDDLPAGTRNLTARFFGGPVATSETSATALRVVGDCSALTPVEAGNGAAVRLVYMELLRRCPDASGYAYWKGQLDEEVVTREEFAEQISDSLEARKVIVNDGYLLMLERPAEAAGKQFWAERLVKNAGYDDLLADLAASAEFRSLAGGTDQGVVTRIYDLLLGRAPSSSDLTFWTSYLSRRGPRQLVRALLRLDEPLAEMITSAYEEILDRAPTAEELAAVGPVFKATFDRSALYASLIGLDEFFDRAQEFPELD